jgi:hypothetical protein
MLSFLRYLFPGVAAMCAAIGLIAHGSTPVATLPLRADGLLVSIAGTINGRTVDLDLDSGGLQYTIIDLKTVNALKLATLKATRVRGGGPGSVNAVHLVPFSIMFSSSAFVARVPIALDYSKVGRPTHQDGLVGFGFFWNYVVAINYDKHLVELYDPESYVYTGTGTKIPLIIKRPRAFVQVGLVVQGAPPQEKILRLDTGSEDAIDDDIILHSTGPKKPIQSGVGIGSRFQAYTGLISKMTIGPYTLRNLTATSGGVHLLGSQVLRNFNVVYDFRHSSMYLEAR